MSREERKRTTWLWWIKGMGILITLVFLITVAELVIWPSDPRAFTPVIRYADLRVCGEDEHYTDADGVPTLAFCRSADSTPTTEPHE